MMDNKLVKLAFLKTFTKEEIQNIIKKNPDMAYELIKTKLIRGQYSLSPQLYIIEYATKEFLKEHQDLVELAVNNGYEINAYANKKSIDYTINEIIATNYELTKKVIEQKRPYIIKYSTANFLTNHTDLIELAIDNGYRISVYAFEEDKKVYEIIATNYELIKKVIEQKRPYILKHSTISFLTQHADLIELAVNNGYKIKEYELEGSIERIINEAIASNYNLTKRLIEQGRLNIINYISPEFFKRHIDLLRFIYNKGYDKSINILEWGKKQKILEIIVSDYELTKMLIEKGQLDIINYVSPEFLNKHKDLVELALDNGYEIDNQNYYVSRNIDQKIKTIITANYKLIKKVIEQGHPEIINYATEKYIKEHPELIKLAVKNKYHIYYGKPGYIYYTINKLIAGDYDLIKEVIVQGEDRTRILDYVTDEFLKEHPDLIDIAIEKGYKITHVSPKIIIQEKYILHVIEKGQINVIQFLQQEEITETIIKESIKKKIGEERFKQELEDFFNYINTVTNKQFTNIEEFIHKNENLYQMILDLGKYTILNDEKCTEEALNKFKELIKITRIMGMNMDLESLLKMDTNLIKQYKSKIWKKLSTHRIFSKDENTKKALIEMIGVFGLFDNDKIKSDINLDILNKLINKVPNRFTKEEYKSILYTNKDVITINQNIENIEELFNKVSGKKYKLRSDMEIPGILNKYEDYFDDELNEKKYQFLKKLVPTGRNGSEMNKFLKAAYEENEEEYYELNTAKLNKDNLNKLTKLILQVDLEGELTFHSIHRIFDGMKQEYNEEFLKFLVENFEMILLDKKHQSDLKQIQKEFEIIKQKNTQDKLTYQFVVDYLEDVEFEHIKVGNETLAKKVKNAGVNSQDAYEYYQSLYEDASKIKYTSLPNYEQEFEINYNGRLTRFRARRLRKNDPLLLLVGESYYTNCCQIYDNAGQECNKHSAQSQNGGVFVTEMFKGGKWILMTQSWDWVNDGVYCHDNIEGTDLYKKSPELRDIVATMYQNHAESIIEISKRKTEEYVSQHVELSKEQLELVKKQIIQLVTVGPGCDDLGVSHYFKKQVEHPRGPKKYNSYRDSYTQYIITGNESDLIDSVTEDELYLYRELRRMKIEYPENISSFTLKMMDDIEQELNIPEDKKKIITEYDEELDNYTQKLKNENQIIISGEDWYLAYEEKENIKIEDLKMKQPRLKDEKQVQTQEILETIKKLINENKKIEIEINEVDLNIYKELLTEENIVIEEKNNSIIISNSDHIEQNKTL